MCEIKLVKVMFHLVIWNCVISDKNRLHKFKNKNITYDFKLFNIKIKIKNFKLVFVWILTYKIITRKLFKVEKNYKTINIK